ncbi:baseplate assembly protein [Streptomyces sioyaensis]|uniref:Baseplate assembly protein n=1 Tax=Streptomyces sioyaensis TaxID=67364 RepID=A0A4Q1QVK2_9ACTN|nr:phage baseplate assembly protein V [Streptomyces sioyaensis]MBM4796782.1 baseplate assembly protein [Streptomyces sioyaensis]RXS62838.1 baseplate assembly protein [Streptomyces sioyaensis]
MTVETVRQWQGLYQGVVVSAVDESRAGLLQVRVPEVLGEDVCVWAAPLTPLAGPDCGMYVVPPAGAGVWVQFLDGDPDRPVWVGFWRGGPGDVPSAAQSADPGTPQIVLATPSQSALVISDQRGPAGGIRLQLDGKNGPFIHISKMSIEISCGGPEGASIKLAGNQVIINGGALMVQ